MSQSKCPFQVGDQVVFTPSERTRGQYQVIERFGIAPNQTAKIKEIIDGTYLYFENGAGGWPWTEFKRVQK